MSEQREFSTPFDWWLASLKWWASFWGRVLSDRPYPGCDAPRPRARSVIRLGDFEATAMIPPVEAASDWEPPRGGVVVDFRREGRL